MIKKIIIENYQSHKKTIIELNTGVNAFIGDSDSGKSAAMRAINWVNSNRPLGEGFISDWSEGCQVTIETETDIIIRKKTKSFNGYIINKSEFDGIGTIVPEQVTKILNLSDINLQSQFDNHFLITSSPGAVAEYLNTVVDLQVIDDSIDRVNKKLKSTKNDIKQKEKLITEYKTGIDKLKYLDELNNEVNKLGKLQSDTDQLEIEHDDILILTEELEELQNQKDDEKDYNEGLQKALLLEKDIDTLENDLAKYEKISNLFSEYENYELDLKNNKKYKIALKEIIAIENDLNELKEAEKKRNELYMLVSSNKNIYLDLSRVKKELIVLQEEYEDYKIDECPLCGRSCNCKENE
jgi:exonuclease SbcC